MDPRRTVLSTATHFLAAVAGGGVWWLVAGAHDPQPAADVAPAGPVASSSRPGTAALQERMAEMEKEGKEDEKWSRRPVREAALDDIAKQPEHEREKAERFAALRSLADTYRQTEDLRGVLCSALAADDTDSSAAIFLEWHRRDPSSAFDELALLSAWSDSLDDEPAVALALGVDEVVAELSKSSRPDDFIGNLSSLMGWHWAEANDLASLAKCHGRLPDEREDELIGDFVAGWVPADAAAAVDTLFASPADFRRRFLTALKKGRFDGGPHLAWSDEFAAALLGKSLGDCENLRAGLQAKADRRGEPRSDTRSLIEDDVVPAAGAGSPELDESQVATLVEQLLLCERDYPALFEAGEMELPEIEAELLDKIPGAERYPEELVRALFRNLATHNPEAAVKWAADKIPDDDIRGISTGLMANFEDPRLSRFAYLLSTLPTRYLGKDYSEWSRARTGKELRKQFAEWAAYAPGPAGEASAGIPERSALSSIPETEEDLDEAEEKEEP